MGRRKPIKTRLVLVMIFLLLIVAVLTSVVGIYSMVSIRSQSIDALTEQLEINLQNSVADKAAIADSEFGRYRDMVDGFAAALKDMYDNPEKYNPISVEPPLAENQGVDTMQRYLYDESKSYEDLSEEIDLVGNIETYWAIAKAQNESIITSIYLGTESGFLLSYDDQSELGVTEGSYESYFEYFESEWYSNAKARRSGGFTNIYQDSYGRGLTISCYSPVYDENGRLRAVVSIDILIANIYRQIVAMSLGEDGEVNMIDGANNTVSSDITKIERISTHIKSEAVLKDIKAGLTGFMLAEDGRYYAYAPVKSIDWQLSIAIPKDTVLMSTNTMAEDIRNITVVFIAALAIFVLVAVLIAHKFANNLTKPLVSLGEDTKIISSGNLSHRAKAVRNDEIGDLATRFNEMAENLHKYIDDLTMVTAEKERIGAELNIATQIQADMLPRIFPPFPERSEFDIYATMDPAKEVGGDFYDFFLVDDDHIAMVMADVSGKGVPAALFMVIAKTLIKNRTQMGGTPSEILEDVNNQLCEGNEAGLFVTVWLGIVQISTGKGIAANAGHEHPAIRRKDGQYEMIKYKHSPALATMDGIPFREHEFELNPGDALFVYTDGVCEATDANNVLFGEERTLNALNKDPNASPKELLQIVKASIDEFVGDAVQFDDITMLGFDYYGKKE